MELRDHCDHETYLQPGDAFCPNCGTEATLQPAVADAAVHSRDITDDNASTTISGVSPDTLRALPLQDLKAIADARGVTGSTREELIAGITHASAQTDGGYPMQPQEGTGQIQGTEAPSAPALTAGEATDTSWSVSPTKDATKGGKRKVIAISSVVTALAIVVILLVSLGGRSSQTASSSVTIPVTVGLTVPPSPTQECVTALEPWLVHISNGTNQSFSDWEQAVGLESPIFQLPTSVNAQYQAELYTLGNAKASTDANNLLVTTCRNFVQIHPNFDWSTVPPVPAL